MRSGICTHVAPPSRLYSRKRTLALSVPSIVATTSPVYQPFCPFGVAGLSEMLAVGGGASATPLPRNCSESTTTPPVEVTYSRPVPVGSAPERVRLTVCQSLPVKAAVANGAAVAEFQRKDRVPLPTALAWPPVMPAKFTGSKAIQSPASNDVTLFRPPAAGSNVTSTPDCASN